MTSATDTSIPVVAPTIRTASIGAAAIFSGIGLGRFAYVPLFPAMVAAGWVSGAEAGLLGAVNLSGYLVGVVCGRSFARRLGTASALDIGMLLAAISCAGCAWNGGAFWLALCRGGAGIAGGTLMALAGPAVQGAVDPARRGIAGGIVMTGPPLGVIAGSVGVPFLLGEGLSAAWLGLAAVITALWLAVRSTWPTTIVPAPHAGERPSGALPLCLAYGISAAGLVPHMVYFGDHVIRGRGLTFGDASLAWLMFGAGGLAGPLLGGWIADRIGAAAALRIWLCFQIAALLLAFGTSSMLLDASAFMAGFSAIGLSAIALARARELAGPASGAIWVQATAAFAVAQATTGFAYAAIFGWTHSHDVLIAIGLAFSVAALVPVLRRSAA